MAPPTPQVPLATLKSLPLELIHKGNTMAQADIYKLDWEGRPAVLKDFSARSWLLRILWGRPVLAREYRALRRLWGVEGIPKLLAQAGADAIVMEWVPGVKIDKKRTAPPAEFFERATRLIGELHSRGIGHGDVRRTNLLMGPEGEPYLIDFATAARVKPGLWGIPARIFFSLYERLDFFQLAQMKADFYPENLTPAESAILNDSPWYLKFSKWFRRYVYRYRKARHRRRLFERLRGRKNAEGAPGAEADIEEDGGE